MCEYPFLRLEKRQSNKPDRRFEPGFDATDATA